MFKYFVSNYGHEANPIDTYTDRKLVENQVENEVWWNTSYDIFLHEIQNETTALSGVVPTKVRQILLILFVNSYLQFFIMVPLRSLGMGSSLCSSEHYIFLSASFVTSLIFEWRWGKCFHQQRHFWVHKRSFFITYLDREINCGFLHSPIREKRARKKHCKPTSPLLNWKEDIRAHFEATKNT